MAMKFKYSQNKEPHDCNKGDVWYCTVDEVSYIFDGVEFLSDSVNDDPYAQLEKYEQDREEDELLRQNYPSLQIIYEEYQMVKTLVRDYDKE